ncbi:hypothetical protein CFter6_0946 [Collimonas fungivorans]|uniref:Uncharacterized protein n=1 Tax=Collimonas fungivorans TaxID=158899 RepID=A0A127P7F9_9BURK|nr:hypothetical protein CFter6_0946 [Collimonas fungivorans]
MLDAAQQGFLFGDGHDFLATNQVGGAWLRAGAKCSQAVL